MPDGGDGRSNFDFVGEYTYRKFNNRIERQLEYSITESFGWGAEAKQKSGQLYLSSNSSQMRRHITNIRAMFPDLRFIPAIDLFSTADVRYSGSIGRRAHRNRVSYNHYQAYYRIVDKKYQFAFIPSIRNAKFWHHIF